MPSLLDALTKKVYSPGGTLVYTAMFADCSVLQALSKLLSLYVYLLLPGEMKLRAANSILNERCE